MQQTILRNSATGEKALSGLAASPVSPALGSTRYWIESVGTKTHLKPSGAAIGELEAFRQSEGLSCFDARASSTLCHSPSSASAHTAQKMKVGVHVMPTFSQLLISAAGSICIAIGNPPLFLGA